MVEALAKGDEVVTAGGLLGRVADLDEQHLFIEIASGVKVQVQRQAVTQIFAQRLFGNNPGCRGAVLQRTAGLDPRAVMNRYPFWKYAILGIALLIGVIFTLPNFFGEAPAVQVSSAKATLKVDLAP